MKYKLYNDFINSLEEKRDYPIMMHLPSDVAIAIRFFENYLTEDELQEGIIKCPYCGHAQKVFYKNKYNMKLKPITSSCFDDDSYKV